MVTKESFFSSQARAEIAKVLNLLANALKITLGSHGRNIMLEKSRGAPSVTKDGVAMGEEDISCDTIGSTLDVTRFAAVLTAPGHQTQISNAHRVGGWITRCSMVVGIGAALFSGCGSGSVPREPGELEIWIANMTEGESLYLATAPIDVVIEIDEDTDQARFAGTLEVDGEEVATAELVYQPYMGMEPEVQFQWNTRPFAVGDHEIVVRIHDEQGREGGASMKLALREAMTVHTFAPVMNDDGVFGGGLELEVHVYNAGSGAWIGCTSDRRMGVPLLVRDLNGEVLPRDAFQDRSIIMRLTEDDDGTPCPAQASLGPDNGIGTVDDLYFESQPFTGGALESNLDLDGTVLAWDRGI